MARGGRKDRPIDRAAGPVAELIDDLRQLRGELSLEEVGRRMGYHSSTVSRRLSPEELPPLEFVRAYVAACGQNPGPWEARWHRAVPPREPPAPGGGSRVWIFLAALAGIAVITAAVVWLVTASSFPSATTASAPVTPQAGQGFAWKIQRMSLRLSSRQWRMARAGHVEIWANLSCPQGVDSYEVTLRPGDQRVRYACGSWQRFTWADVSPGVHYFDVDKADDGLSISGEGVVRATSEVVEVLKTP